MCERNPIINRKPTEKDVTKPRSNSLCSSGFEESILLEISTIQIELEEINAEIEKYAIAINQCHRKIILIKSRLAQLSPSEDMLSEYNMSNFELTSCQTDVKNYSDGMQILKKRRTEVARMIREMSDAVPERDVGISQQWFHPSGAVYVHTMGHQ
jgi:chromosome segregation ATPase